MTEQPPKLENLEQPDEIGSITITAARISEITSRIQRVIRLIEGIEDKTKLLSHNKKGTIPVALFATIDEYDTAKKLLAKVQLGLFDIADELKAL